MNKNFIKHSPYRFAMAVILTAVLISQLVTPISAFALISPLPADSVADGGAASTAFQSDHGQYSTWENPSSGFAVDSEYAYRFKQGDATFTPFGKQNMAGGETASADHGHQVLRENHFMFSVKPGDNDKGDIGFWARNLKIRNSKTGNYDKVDMKVTVRDWDLGTGKQNYIILQKSSRPNIKICDVVEAKVRFEYFHAGTDKRYTVKANLTYNDIDAMQYLAYKPNVVKYQYVAKNSLLNYKNVDGYYTYHRNASGNDTTDTPRLASGITFDANMLDMIFGTNENDSDHSTWSHFGQYGYSMANIEPADPVKTVSDSDETMVDSNTLGNKAEAFTYKVVQPIPAGLSDKMFYSRFTVEDQIDTCLLIDHAWVTQEGHGDKSDWFNITASGNKVTATAKGSALTDEDFYGGGSRSDTEFTLNIRVKIDPAKSDSQLKSHGHFNTAGDVLTFRNKASTSITNNVSTYSKDTNEVDTIVLIPTKKVSDMDEQLADENTIINANEVFSYSIRQGIAAGMGTEPRYYKSFVISDAVDSCVSVKSAKVVQDGGADRTGWFDIDKADGKVKAAAKPSAISDAAFYNDGKSTGYTLLIEAELNKSKTVAELKAHGHFNSAGNGLSFLNKGTVTIDGSPEVSNEVVTKVGVPDLSIEKDVNRYEHQAGDRIKYSLTVSHLATSTADATDVTIKDVSLPKGFDLDVNSLKVSGLSTRNPSFEKHEGGFVFRTGLIGKTETAVITFDVIADPTHNGKIVNNKASVTAYSMRAEKEGSASVYINSPKLNLAKTTHKGEYKVGDTISYRLELTQRNTGTFMRDIKIADSITHSGIMLIPGSIQVMDSGNKIITHQCDITISGNAFSVGTHLNIGDGSRTVPPKEAGIAPYAGLALENKLVVTYDVSVTGDEIAGFAVRNTAAAPTRPNTYGDLIKDDPDIPSGGDTKEKETPIVGATLKIIKSSDKKVYAVSESAIYTLNVNQIREDYTAKNVVVKDSLDTTFASIIPDSIHVEIDNEDITEGCGITLSETGTGFEIKTSHDLKWGEDLIVSYEVKFAGEAAGTTIRNLAVTGADNAEEKTDKNAVAIVPGDVVPVESQLAIVKTSDKETYSVGDEVHYTLDTSCVSSEAAINVSISDKIQTEGVVLNPASIKVLHEGDDITSACAIEFDGNGFTINTGITLLEGNHIIVAYTAVIESEDIAGQTIGNTAVASADNGPGAETNHEVTVDELGPGPEDKPSDEDNPGSDSGSGYGQPKTGDSFNPWILAVLGFGILGIAASIIYRRKAAKRDRKV